MLQAARLRDRIVRDDRIGPRLAALLRIRGFAPFHSRLRFGLHIWVVQLVASLNLDQVAVSFGFDDKIDVVRVALVKDWSLAVGESTSKLTHHPCMIARRSPVSYMPTGAGRIRQTWSQPCTHSAHKSSLTMLQDKQNTGSAAHPSLSRGSQGPCLGVHFEPRANNEQHAVRLDGLSLIEESVEFGKILIDRGSMFTRPSLRRSLSR